jgi:phosphatidylserine/phosphatidylglycerophosphate/cardiolipin synthase-like enzyme
VADTDALQLALVRAARTLPDDQLRQLADVLVGADVPSPGMRARARSLVATDVFSEAVSEIVDAWSAVDALPGSALALALRASASAARAERDEEEVEVVWTGPTTSAVALRRTRLVLFELIRRAASRITLVSYAAFRQDDLVEELRAAVRRGVRVRLVLESAAASRGRLDDDAARAFAALGGAVEVLEWPAELRGDGRAAGVLHAKAVVVDGRVALISSANLTAAALDHNMELGLLVEGGKVPRRLEEHFAELQAKGILRPVVAD